MPVHVRLVQDQFAQVREAFDLRQPFIFEADPVKKMVAEGKHFQSRNARKEAQILASVAPAIRVAIPERSGQMQFFEMRRALRRSRSGGSAVHTYPIEGFNLNGVTWQPGDVGKIARLSGKPHASAHGKRPFGNRPVGTVRSQGGKNEKKNEDENARHELRVLSSLQVIPGERTRSLAG